ncbi:MAG: hypothetical protein H6994_05180 [Pseudomonadales bacterium]|nr:hypothetical protein [Pseudomonadales bacterium]
MSWVAEHWVLVGLFAVYTTFLLRNAATGGAQARDASGYFVGGRKLGGVAVGISFFATFASTNSYVGHAGKSYAWGLPWLTLAVLIVLFTWLSWRAVAPRMRALAADFDALTLPDLLALRFPHANGGNLLRVLAGVVVVFCSVLYLVAIFKGAGNVFELFLDVPYETAVGITLLIVVAYTAIGGFVSVVRTDVVQGVMMVVGSIAMFYFVTRAAGGVTRLPELAESPETASLFQFGAAVPFAVLLGMSLSGAMKLLVDPRQLSRFFALRDAHQVNVGVWVAVVGIALIQFCLFPIGVYAHFLLQGVTDTDRVVPMLITDPAVFPPVVADFLILAIIAAAMSSMDSVLLVAASVLYRDLAAVVRPSLPAVRFTRMAVVGFAVLSALLALDPPGGIVEITLFSGSLYAACFFPAVLLGLHWRRGSAAAVIVSMLVGVTVLLGWQATPWQATLHEVFPALVASVVAYVVVALFSPSDASAETA